MEICRNNQKDKVLESWTRVHLVLVSDLLISNLSAMICRCIILRFHHLYLLSHFSLYFTDMLWKFCWNVWTLSLFFSINSFSIFWKKWNIYIFLALRHIHLYINSLFKFLKHFICQKWKLGFREFFKKLPAISCLG